jgi:hypothetical protein
MTLPSDFSDAELYNVREMLTQRYKKDVEIELADCELRLDRNSGETTKFPTIFWHERGTNFVVFKVGMFRYRTQFFYTPHEQYGTGIDEYRELEECVAAVLQTQSDHEREQQGADSATTGENSN